MRPKRGNRGFPLLFLHFLPFEGINYQTSLRVIFTLSPYFAKGCKVYAINFHNEEVIFKIPLIFHSLFLIFISMKDLTTASKQLEETNKKLKRRLYDLYTLFELSQHLNSVLELEPLLDSILLTCIGQMGVGGATLLLTQREKLKVAKAKGMNPRDLLGIEIGAHSHLGRFLSQTNQAILFCDLERIERAQKDVEKLRSLECEVCVPLNMKGRLKGVLTLTPKISGAPFTENELEFLTTMANQMGVAIENAELYESVKFTNLELRRTQQQLIQSENLATVGRLAATLAHEINNPLGIIKNYLTLLSREGNHNPDAIEVVKEEVDRIGKIVRQLLDLSRPISEPKSLIDINQLIRETSSILRKQLLEEKITLEEDLFPLSLLKASPGQLKQVFLNLITNAKKAMPQGGRLKISTKMVNDFVEIAFSDTGEGIREEDGKRLFQPFYTTKKDGLGLGLSICQEIIRNHGGEIVVQKGREKGTIFTIRLPAESL